MSILKAWIAAARLRTLPLSVSGIVVGASLGINSPTPLYKSPIFWLAILTTIGFQVLSNFANDYGDGVKGTDKDRQGEQRMVASGIITPKQMRVGMYITAGISLFLSSMLIFAAFGNSNMLLAFIFFNLAIAAVIAAVRYTVGKKAYGYSGKGDIFVFVFFGHVAVLGSYFLYAKTLTLDIILPAISIGVFSVAVLNLNNMRDIENDKRVGKVTVVVNLGSRKAKRYHIFLLGLGILTALFYTILHYKEPLQFVYVIAFLPLLWNLKVVIQNEIPALLDSELKKVALSTFLFAILFSIFH